MIVVPLTMGLHSIVDDEDGPLVGRYEWQAVSCNGIWYARRGTSYSERDSGMPSVQYMHSLITGFALTDHINGLSLDNRRENLREATNAQNMMNRRPYSGTSSKYKGVQFYKRTGRWRAYIQVDRKSRHLGYYSTEEEAALAYNEAAAKEFGAYARLNPVSQHLITDPRSNR